MNLISAGSISLDNTFNFNNKLSLCFEKDKKKAWHLENLITEICNIQVESKYADATFYHLCFRILYLSCITGTGGKAQAIFR